MDTFHLPQQLLHPTRAERDGGGERVMGEREREMGERERDG
jgi:hypothetical protein